MQSEKSRLNWLRAAVLGANDGIVSIAGLVVGVAGATQDVQAIAMAGIAGLLAGALSMAAGEYVSVSTQRDAERSYIRKERRMLKNDPEGALQELIGHYQERGLSKALATKVAKERTAHNALAAHLEIEFGLDEDDLTNPWHAAFASAISFTVGGLIPLAAILLPPVNLRVPVAFVSVMVALLIAGYISAKLSKANIGRAVRRVVVGGAFAMLVTYVIGHLFGVAVG